jgi:pyruvate dehydrogenase E1 component alpha subunit
MDISAVADAGARAVHHARHGAGPYILEMLTYRYRGHSMSDPAKYRTREEVKDMREHHDPIDLVGKRLMDAGIATEEDLKTIDKEIRAIVGEAADFAMEDPEPDPEELWTDVLVESQAPSQA